MHRLPEGRPSARRALHLVLTLVAVAWTVGPAVADDRPVQFQYSDPTYGIRIYEVFQRGPELQMVASTSRAFGPNLVRNVLAGEVWPPEDEAPLAVRRNRNHLEYFGSYWREDGTPSRGTHEVEVWEVEESDTPGVAWIRVRLVERTGSGASFMAMEGRDDMAVADEGPVFGVRLYEVLQRGSRLELQERTTRHFGPNHPRGLMLGVAFPPDGETVQIWKSRDHLAFLGSYWSVRGRTDAGAYEVEVWEADEPREPGTARVRMRVIDRAVDYPAPTHRYQSPERAAKQAGRPLR